MDGSNTGTLFCHLIVTSNHIPKDGLFSEKRAKGEKPRISFLDKISRGHEPSSSLTLVQRKCDWWSSHYDRMEVLAIGRWPGEVKVVEPKIAAL